MTEIMYRPEDVGKEVMNSHGKLSKIRKYHLTEQEKVEARNKWVEEIKHVNKRTVKKAGTHFFNPYRRGIYYYQIYSMFLLGANQWHSLSKIIDKMEVIMSRTTCKSNGVHMTIWEKFRGKSSRDSAIRCKDFVGRIQENMGFFQRLNKLHPTGYKLMQVHASVDMKRITKKGFVNGCYFYRLSTHDSMDLALPIRDYSRFKFPRHERKYVNYKFIGKIITMDKVISEGKVDALSQV